jgi:serine/threonine-protein kinase
MVLAGDFAHAEELARFQTEAEAAARLQHPTIVQVYEIGEHDGKPFFTMEYVEGGSLAQAINGTPQPVQRAAALVETLARAMHYAHERGIVHRDLKPANVLLSGSDVKITDFGLAKLLIGGSGQTETGMLIGTPSYMSPQQAAGNVRAAGPPIDIYALGAILYEMLTGRPPFRAESPVETLQQVQSLDPLAPRRLQPKLPRDIETICLKCLEKDPAGRYPTAEDLAEDLRRFLAGEPIRARPAGPVERLIKWAKRRPTAAALWAVSLTALLLLGGIWAWLAQVQSQRRAAAAMAIGQALDEAQQLREEAQASGEENLIGWTRALDAAKRAGAIAEQGYSTANLSERVLQMTGALEVEVQDRRMSERLEEIRLRQLAPNSQERAPDFAGIDSAYTQAFEGYGVPIEQAPPDAVAASIRERKINDKLVGAFDDWFFVRTNLPAAAGKSSLLEIARLADPDPWRNRLRDALAKNDRQSLRKLAGEVDAAASRPPTFILLSNTLVAVGDLQAAVDVLQKGVQRYPGDFWINHQLGLHLAKRERDLDEAIRFLSVARALRTKSAFVHGNLGTALARRKRYDEAIASFREAILLDKDDLNSYRNLAEALQDSGKPGEAVAVIQDRLRLHPDDPSLQDDLGRAYYAQRNLDKAIAAFQSATHLKPDYAEAYTHLGTALHDKGELDQAIAAHRQAIRVKKDYAEAYNNLGNALYYKRQLDDAVTACREAIRLKKDFPEAYNNLGNCLYDQRKPDEAITAYREAIRLKKNFAFAYGNLGNALRDQGRLDDAIAAYRQAVGLKRDYAQAHVNLANAVWQKGALDWAIAELREAISYRPTDAFVHSQLGRALRQKGSLDEALAECREAIRLRHDFPPVHSHLGDVLYDQGKIPEALAAYQEAIRLKKEQPEAHYGLGNCLSAQKKLDEAIAEYREAIRLKKTFPQAEKRLADCLRAKESPDAAPSR